MAVSSAKRVSAKAVSANAVANEFLKLAKKDGKQLTNLQLQKLVYIAQGYTLAITNKKLYYNDTCAWHWGPVIPSLYEALRRYGRKYVIEKLELDNQDESLDNTVAIDIIEAVYKRYGNYTGPQLVNLTNRPNTPWSETWEEEKFSLIPFSRIQDYYKRTLKNKKEAYLQGRR
ncbi:MAG: DUF4065 domain-containing protein [Aphanocapsa feldmannii 277cV]|uniref:DUF4065 domain-containing protein n=1 Tax=Aphanocapsa feldmannii 277cV TaxID=2507553 RepID=A0A524RKQ2_9CHRO|nr:MAG: DUF4065 domain-containing protein [Aphanocapsa feldmannii 277cV]